MKPNRLLLSVSLFVLLCVSRGMTRQQTEQLG
jgi:hypothetical protein